jgi:hypothetical protein
MPGHGSSAEIECDAEIILSEHPTPFLVSERQLVSPENEPFPFIALLKRRHGQPSIDEDKRRSILECAVL